MAKDSLESTASHIVVRRGRAREHEPQSLKAHIWHLDQQPQVKTFTIIISNYQYCLNVMSVSGSVWVTAMEAKLLRKRLRFTDLLSFPE